MEDNARLDAAADRAVTSPRRLITMLDMSAHRRTRRIAASTAADYCMLRVPGDVVLLLYVTNDLLRYEVRRKPSLWLLRYLNALS